MLFDIIIYSDCVFIFVPIILLYLPYILIEYLIYNKLTKAAIYR